MDLRTDSRALALIKQLLDPTVTTKPQLDTLPQKPLFKPAPIKQPFTRATPESQGIPSEQVAAFITELRADNSLDPHGFLLLRHGKLIADVTFGAYRHDVWHITHSECKSITGLAIGMLVDEGKLSVEDRLVDVLGEKTVGKVNALTHKGIQIKHLLTMTSGILFNEAGSVTEKDWVKCYMSSVITSEPGSTFNYNSMNTYMLSAVVKAVTGEGLVQYLTPRLFAPLGIENFFWETCPMGIEKGGWGLYIMPEDIAKIGQMVLDKGVWKGKRIVSEAWIDAATAKHAEAPANFGAYNYGYQIWVGREEHSFLFNGMFGQNVLGYFDSGILLVSNAGNNELFQQSSQYPIADKYFGAVQYADTPIRAARGARSAVEKAKKYAATELHRTQPQLFGELMAKTPKRDIEALCQCLDGKTYKTTDKHAAALGVNPLYAQALQNNLAKGVRGLAFASGKDGLVLTVMENDANHVLPIGFDKPKYTQLDFHGEAHQVAVYGRFDTDEDATPVLTVRVSFLESANARIIKFFFSDGKLLSRWMESPGKTYLTGAMDSVRKQVAFVDTILQRTDEELFVYAIERAFECEADFTEV
ncbi:MAG: serine hydrolase [Clostridia bacterium]|nr:serine hydrolase [Clostridia bacterium]